MAPGSVLVEALAPAPVSQQSAARPATQVPPNVLPPASPTALSGPQRPPFGAPPQGSLPFGPRVRTPSSQTVFDVSSTPCSLYTILLFVWPACQNSDQNELCNRSFLTFTYYSGHVHLALQLLLNPPAELAPKYSKQAPNKSWHHVDCMLDSYRCRLLWEGRQPGPCSLHRLASQLNHREAWILGQPRHFQVCNSMFVILILQ